MTSWHTELNTVIKMDPPRQDYGQIEVLRAKLGKDLIILGHHYQADSVITHVDKVGDSLELASIIEHIFAKHIVFCGVHFMAETACLLSSSAQQVYLPDIGATCTMADMVPYVLLENIIRKLTAYGRRIIPLAYVNTSLAVKAVVGKYGGAVCTSANAKNMLAWALNQGNGVIFLPDRHLGNNAANLLGLPEHERHVLDIRNAGNNLDMAAISAATLLLWPGCCSVHHLFSAKYIEKLRATHPDAKIYVHPECAPATVAAADGAGSTTYLIKQAAEAPDGAILGIGTEINLVRRLQKLHAGRLTIIPLYEKACSNMAKVDTVNLLSTLQSITYNKAMPIHVDLALLGPAKDSLTRMLKNTN